MNKNPTLILHALRTCVHVAQQEHLTTVAAVRSRAHQLGHSADDVDAALRFWSREELGLGRFQASPASQTARVPVIAPLPVTAPIHRTSNVEAHGHACA
jgi:hypothetical protein